MYGISRDNAAPELMPHYQNYPATTIFLNISTMVSSLEAALDNLTLQDVPNFRRTVREYGTVESTLRRRYKGQTVFRHEATSLYRRKLTDAQKDSLIRQINVLIDRGIPSISTMMKNFVEEIVKGSMRKN